MTEPLTHVFVCHSALSFHAACRIFEDLRASTGDVRAEFLILYRCEQAIPSGAHVHVMRPAPEEFGEWRRPFAYARFFKGVDARLREAAVESIVAYLPHPFEIVGNFFFFTDPRVVRRELLPDGFLNYVHRSLAPTTPLGAARILARIGLRLLSAKLNGFWYHPFVRGHVTQYERQLYDRSWTENERGYITRSGVVQGLPSSETSLDAARPHAQVLKGARPCALFVDQEIRQIAEPKLEQQLRSRMAKLIEERGIRTLFYKGHPRGENRFASVEKWAPTVIDLTGEHRAEDLLRESSDVHIFGFYSTTLLMTEHRLGRDRVAVLPEPHAPGCRRTELVAQLEAALLSAGATVVRI